LTSSKGEPVTLSEAGSLSSRRRRVWARMELRGSALREEAPLASSSLVPACCVPKGAGQRCQFGGKVEAVLRDVDRRRENVRVAKALANRKRIYLSFRRRGRAMV